MFGQATALEGPASALGLGMKMGLEAAFAAVNKAGGVKGRKLELKRLDDGHQPTKSVEASASAAKQTCCHIWFPAILGWPSSEQSTDGFSPRRWPATQ